MKFLLCFAAVIFSCLPAGAGLPESAQETPALHEVKRIYVAPMAGGRDSFIIMRLMKWKEIQVVFKPEDADAILMGASEEKYYGWAGAVSSETKGEVMLIDPSSRAPLWSAKKGDGFWGGGNSKVAERIVKQLKKDYEKSANKRSR